MKRVFISAFTLAPLDSGTLSRIQASIFTKDNTSVGVKRIALFKLGLCLEIATESELSLDFVRVFRGLLAT